jgi:hypothetical protein
MLLDVSKERHAFISKDQGAEEEFHENIETASHPRRNDSASTPL